MKAASVLLALLISAGTVAAQPAAGQGSGLIDIWRSCIAGEFAKAWLNTFDDNRAIELAFVACHTEQDAVEAVLSVSAPQHAHLAIAAAKLRIKRQILGH